MQNSEPRALEGQKGDRYRCFFFFLPVRESDRYIFSWLHWAGCRCWGRSCIGSLSRACCVRCRGERGGKAGALFGVPPPLTLCKHPHSKCHRGRDSKMLFCLLLSTSLVIMAACCWGYGALLLITHFNGRNIRQITRITPISRLRWVNKVLILSFFWTHVVVVPPIYSLKAMLSMTS